jgi:transposase InsO family protein
MAIYARRSDNLDQLVHHNDRGVQYLSIRYTERLAEAGVSISVGSRGDCLFTGYSSVTGRDTGEKFLNALAA